MWQSGVVAFDPEVKVIQQLGDAAADFLSESHTVKFIKRRLWKHSQMQLVCGLFALVLVWPISLTLPLLFDPFYVTFWPR
jgi:hypothetical protein